MRSAARLILPIYNLHPIHSKVLMATPSLPVDEEYDRPFASVTAFKTQEPSAVRDMWSPSYSGRVAQVPERSD